MENEKVSIKNKDLIDIIEILKKLWSNRKMIIKISSISLLIGIIVALFSPVVYTAQTTFVPQTSESGSSVRGLGTLASIAGINISDKTSSSSLDNYTSPFLYPKIVDSEEFSISLIDEEIIDINGNKTTLKDYISNNSGFKLNPLGIIKKYTIGLFSSNDYEITISEEINEEYNFISSGDYAVIKLFRSKFSIELDEKEGYIKVIAHDKDPFVSTQIVKLVTRNLQSSIISLRTSKIKEQLDYSEKQYKLKQNEFEVLQNKLAEFKDSNKNISTAVFMAELQKLESEFLLQQSILTNLASEYNNNKIKLNKDTPIFSVIDEVSVPNERSKPKRSLIALASLIIGIILSSLHVLFYEQLSRSFKS